MRKQVTLFFTATIFFIAVSYLSACNSSSDSSRSANSSSGCDSLLKNYDMVMNSNGIIILRKKDSAADKEAFTAKAALNLFQGGGKIIDDSVANAEIQAFRDKYTGNWTKYVDFNFEGLANYFTTIGRGQYPVKDLGIRVYPALTSDTKVLTLIFAPTYKDTAIWRHHPKNLGQIKLDDPTSPFNTGSICPCNCPAPEEGVSCLQNR